MGFELAYRSSAGTGRTVVLVHGNSSSSAVWQGVLDGPFGSRFRCLAVDLPGHGASPRVAGYSLPVYASALADFVPKDAVVVGWSLGGHAVLHAARSLDHAAGFVIFGTPPIATAASLAEAFLPNPAFNVGFQGEVSTDDAIAYANAMLAPGSAVSPDVFVPDILATDPAARSGLAASVGEGRFVNEVEVVASLTKPLLVLHGGEDQLVSLDYLRSLGRPVDVLDGVGHAIPVEAPDLLAQRLADFLATL
ncbi:alpha/beta fold hydrolase [Kutzneria sp. CA-103260]|uniref:alpha/beta fold hydrolase n=1 Tax=Kutzneria sp. CA-103260 TaxID=2802641 RepID=UPI001BAA831F|nr:alpha/beta hydrolase [Kutzneria sp. CA-103260]QUQ63639.1 alpha/beta hydrolase [Kutzneria sp. CA-103260]